MRRFTVALILLAVLTMPFSFLTYAEEKVWKLGDRVVPGPLPPNMSAPIPQLDIQKDVVYGTVEGVELKLDFAKPKLCKNQKVPLVVFIHGGGWKSGDKGDSHLNKGGITMFYQLGFAFASINYRLTPTYKFPAQVNDCKLAIRFLRTNANKFGIDPDRIGIWGSSAGGHLVSILSTANDNDGLEGPGLEGVSSRIACVVDYFGPTDFSGIKGDYNNNNGISMIKDFFGCDPWECPEIARLASPVTYCDKDDPPMLIQHGDMDNLVPYSQGESLAKHLFAVNVPCALIKVKNAGHGFAPIKRGTEIKPSYNEITKKTVYHLVRYLEPSTLGDLNLDGKIDLSDAIELAYLFGANGTDKSGQAAIDTWNPLADLVADGKIDLKDWNIFWKVW